MVLLDVNILVQAHLAESPQHAAVRQWLDDCRTGTPNFGVPELVFSSFVRVATLSKAWNSPSTLPQAMGFCKAIMASPRCMVLRPSERHWQIFERLCRATDARGNLITDAYLAAFAIDADSEWITFDQDFRRFPGLTWRGPFDRHATTNPR